MTKIEDGENAEYDISLIAAGQQGRQALEIPFPALTHTLAWTHYERYTVRTDGEPHYPKVSALAALLQGSTSTTASRGSHTTGRSR